MSRNLGGCAVELSGCELPVAVTPSRRNPFPALVRTGHGDLAPERVNVEDKHKLRLNRVVHERLLGVVAGVTLKPVVAVSTGC